jgi:hypothetical protein
MASTMALFVRYGARVRVCFDEERTRHHEPILSKPCHMLCAHFACIDIL